MGSKGKGKMYNVELGEDQNNEPEGSDASFKDTLKEVSQHFSRIRGECSKRGSDLKEGPSERNEFAVEENIIQGLESIQGFDDINGYEC